MTAEAHPGAVSPFKSVAFLGPPGTFTEEALLAESALSQAEMTPFPTIGEVLGAVDGGDVDAGFVPIENSIEGTVAVTIDHLVFESDLLIQAEAVLDIHLHLLARPGVAMGDIKRVVSFPHASAQCRRFVREVLGGAEVVASNSTAEAARLVGAEELEGTAAIAPMLSGRLYGLQAIAENIEDYGDNQTRFWLVAPTTVPAPTGHDRTSIVCFQQADHPGSLHEMLSHFSARSLNLTKIESRPTKQGLGDYCFVIDLDGHVADEVVGDCLRELHAGQAGVKFLGSYPAAGAGGDEVRQAVSLRRQQADVWLSELRRRIQGS
ncbi:MAG TPA: prephenate dehydratase [Acidimicrobiales bacterium]|jgi:prephenate dehydratase|nr:prephenate dehydratase [Acidimicrobiales bacterium]